MLKDRFIFRKYFDIHEGDECAEVIFNNWGGDNYDCRNLILYYIASGDDKYKRIPEYVGWHNNTRFCYYCLFRILGLVKNKVYILGAIKRN